jgi:eukaryotic-like serine/threonine-protein kinase
MSAKHHADLVAELFDSALECDTTQRAAFLDQRCRGDGEIRAEVESLLRAAKQAEGFMEGAAAEVAEVERTLGAFAVGEIVGEYEVVSVIGRGGMGEVYLANDRRVKRRVALKLVRGGLDRETLTRRFQREQQLLAGLNHPNIAQLYETGVTAEGIPFFAMEFVDGIRLDQFLKQRPIDLPAKLNLFRKICAAIAYAHQHLVIHRDIKPANILVTPEGEPKLLDFGIAKLLDEMADDAAEQTLTVNRMLTPDYASPEQVRGEPISTASDVYSLGVVFYELLTGARPYRLTSRSSGEVTRAITDQEPIRPSENRNSKIENPKSLRGDLDNIALMALRKEPARRYASANAFSQDLRRYLEGLPVHARKDTFGYRAAKFAQRNRAGVVLGSIAVAAVVVAFCVTLAQKRKADRRFNDVRQIANSLLFEVEGELQQGPTKAREKLVSHAVTYLDRLATEVRSDPALQVEVAAGYLKVGDIQGKPFYANTGDTAGALASYAKAVDMLEPLASSLGGNRAAMRYLSQAWQSIGRVQRRAGKWSDALTSSRKAVALAESLVKAEPANDVYRSLLAEDYIHLGTALFKTEYAHTAAELTEALGYYRKALSIHTELLKTDPANAEYRSAAATDYFWVGAALQRLGYLSGDRESYERASENFRAQVTLNADLLQTDPTNNRYRRAWADAVMNMSAQDGSRESSLVRENLRPAFTVIESIAAADPANVEARRDLALAQYTLADSVVATGDVTGALDLARKAFTTLESLVQHEPNNGDAVLTAIRCCHQIGSLEKVLGHQEAVVAAYENALRIANDSAKLKQLDIPTNRLRAITLFRLGELDEAKANWSRAKELYQRSQAFWREIPDDVLSPDDRALKNEATERVLRIEREISAR